MVYTIPLSYNPVDSVSLERVLNDYRGRDTVVISDFEKAITNVVKVKYAVALNSGTAAIHLALKALGVTAGDEVIVSTFTYIGTVNPILYLGAVPVFVDCDPQTWNMSPQLLEEAIQDSLKRNKKIKAILVVHSYGMPAPMTQILNIASGYGIPVLEDAAEALGSTFEGRPLGSLGELGVLSFNNNKLLTTYGGGALLTNSAAVYEQVLYWATQARESKPFYEHCEVGYNYRMSLLNAACGLAAWEGLDERIRRRREIFSIYQSLLGPHLPIQFQEEPPGLFSNRWLTTLWVDTASARNVSVGMLQQELAKQGIEARPLWNPMHLQPVFRQYANFDRKISLKLFTSGLCLPSSHELEHAEQQKVTSIIQRVLAITSGKHLV